MCHVGVHSISHMNFSSIFFPLFLPAGMPPARKMQRVTSWPNAESEAPAVTHVHPSQVLRTQHPHIPQRMCPPPLFAPLLACTSWRAHTHTLSPWCGHLLSSWRALSLICLAGSVELIFWT